MQAFSINIPTVLQAIQQTGTTPSNSLSTGTNVGCNAGSTTGGEKVSSSQVQGQELSCGSVGSQEGQRKTVSSEYSNPRSSVNTETDVSDSTSGRQITPEGQNQEKAETSQSNATVSQGVNEKRNEINDALEAKRTDTESSVSAQIPRSGNNNGALGPIAHARLSTDRVEAGNKSSAAMPAVSTSQAARRRAPAIPPLPPCYTTLKTYKSLQLLRPHLQKIAAMLNTVPRSSTTGSSTCQQFSSSETSGSHSNKKSIVTCVSGNEARHTDEPRSNDAAVKSRNVGGRVGGVITNDQVVSSEYERDLEGSNVFESTQAPSTCVSDVAEEEGSETVAKQLQTSERPSHLTNNGREETLSGTNSSRVQGRVVLPTVTANGEGNSSSAARVVTNRPVQNNRPQNASEAAPVVRSNNTSYRNSFEYRMLSSRFNSLFLWPALLSKIQIKLSSQIGPVFAERHPPPRGGSIYNTENPTALKRKPTTPSDTDTVRRKQRGLAAVRMASSASLATPGQQMSTVGQGFAIRKNAPPRQPDESPGSKEVVVAASQLLSLQEATRTLSMSTADKRPYSTRQSKRKVNHVKRYMYSGQESDTKRKKLFDSSDSYSSPSEDDDEDESDYLPEKEIRNIRETRSVPNTRQSSLRNLRVSRATDSSVQARAPSTTTGTADNAVEVVSSDYENSIDCSINESRPSLQDVQEDRDVRPTQDEEVSEQESSDVNMSRNNNTNNSPSSASKRKNTKPEKNRGASWRAMLPKVVDSEDSDV